ERIWILQQIEPEGAAYNVPAAVRTEGPPDLAALSGVLSEVVRRHESLRTTFSLADGRLLQRISPPLPVPLPLVDLTAVPAGGALAEAQRLAVWEIHRPFDLERDLLLRPTLVRLAPRDHVLLLTMHHITCDLWSRTILLREIGALHAAGRAGRPCPLPEL